jgi:hypothetical protein
MLIILENLLSDLQTTTNKLRGQPTRNPSQMNSIVDKEVLINH